MLIAACGFLKVACEWRFAAETWRCFIIFLFFKTNLLEKMGNEPTTNQHHSQHTLTSMATNTLCKFNCNILCGLWKSNHPQSHSLNLCTIKGERYWCYLRRRDNVMMHSIRLTNYKSLIF